jgi:hypothetical protein
MALLLTQAILVGLAAGQTVSANILRSHVPKQPQLYATITSELQTCYQGLQALWSLYSHSYAPYNAQLSFVVELELTVNSSLTPQVRPPTARQVR